MCISHVLSVCNNMFLYKKVYINLGICTGQCLLISVNIN